MAARLAPRPADTSLAAADEVRAARERAGLSLRECAKLLRVPHQTLWDLEHGRDARLSVVEAALRHLPGLRPHVLLHEDEPPLLPASRSAWEHYANASGFAASRVSLHVRASGSSFRCILRTDGLRARSAVIGSQAHARALCEVASSSHLGVPRGVPEGAAGRHEAEEGGRHHAWTIAGEPAEVDHVATWQQEAATCAWSAELPAEELLLSLEAGEGAVAGARLACWPRSAPDDPDEEVAGRLYPAGVEIRWADGAVTARIPHPLPQVRYALVLGSTMGVGMRAESLPARVAARRRELGLGLRTVGKASGLSPMACRHVEKGEREPGLSTVRALARALDMDAGAVFAHCFPNETRDVAEYYRWLHGIVASTVTKRLDVFADGSATVVVETRQLRSLRVKGKVAVRMAMARAVLQRSPDVLVAVEADTADARTRTVRHADGASEHVFRFGHRDSQGVSYIRRFARTPQFAMSIAEAEARFGTSDYEAGTSIPIVHPTDVLRLQVRFPKGFEPARISGHCWPAGQLQTGAVSLAANPSPRAMIESGARGLVASLCVRSPLPGFKYGLGWSLPDPSGRARERTDGVRPTLHLAEPG